MSKLAGAGGLGQPGPPSPNLTSRRPANNPSTPVGTDAASRVDLTLVARVGSG